MVLRNAGKPGMRAVADMSYLFTSPLLVDETASVEHLGLSATPLDEAAAATVSATPASARPRAARAS